MSFQAMAWAVKQDLITRDKFVLIMLANYASNETGDCYPSINTLCDVTNMSRQTIISAIKSLEEIGALRVKREMLKGINLPNSYTLDLNFLKQKPECTTRINAGGVVQMLGGGSLNAVGGVVCQLDSNLSIKPINKPIIKEKVQKEKIEKTQTTAVQAPPPHSDNNQDVSFLKASIVKTETKGLSTKKNEQWLFLVSEFGTPEQVAKDFMQTRKTALTNTSLGRIVKQASIASISVSAAIEFTAERGWQTFYAESYASNQTIKQSAKPAKQSFSLGCDNSVDWTEEARKANDAHLKRRGGIPMTQQEEDEIPF